MLRPELVEYIKENLKHFSSIELRRQLMNEGVSDLDFDEALRAVTALPIKPAKKSLSRNYKLLLLAGGILLCLAAGLLLFQSPSSDTPDSADQGSGAAVTQEQSAFLGHSGYVVHLPPGYGYAQDFEDPRRTIERVYFCRTGTSRADFINTGLYGSLGIVRLEARPNPWIGHADAQTHLSDLVFSRLRNAENAFTVKDIQVGTLRGIQVDFAAPFTHVEAYLLGEKTMFSFYAGKDDDMYKAILMSLREEGSDG